MSKLKGAAAFRKKLAAKKYQTYLVTLPESGIEFELRNPNFEVFAVGGQLPTGIAEKMESLQKKGLDEQEAFQQLSATEQSKAIEFGKTLVSYICVSPKVAETAEDDETITFAELLEFKEDFEFLVNWAKSGGGEAEKAENFRQRRQPMVMAMPDGAGSQEIS